MYNEILATLERLLRRKSMLAATAVVVGVFSLAILAPFCSPYDPNEMNTEIRLRPPDKNHLFGTDKFGRDILSRILWGARISIYVGGIAVSIAVSMGASIGMISGYYGGKIDAILTRIIDAMLSFPDVLLGLILMTLLGIDIGILMVAIGLVFTPQFARLARSHTLITKEKLYVEAAKCVGDSDFYILSRHILPSLFFSIVIQATLSFGYAILYEAGFSFLGLGVKPPTPSWGSMLSESRGIIDLAPWTSIFPGLAIVIVVLSLNLIGDGLRDVLDPRLRID